MEDKGVNNLEGLFKGADLSGAQIIVVNHGEVNYAKHGKEENDTMPTAEQMASAVETTLKAGLWWGNTAWSVVFRVMQMMGYNGKISQFVNMVAEWPLKSDFPYKCNDDAVSKPIRTGKMSRSLDKWAEDGASSQFIILGKELMKALAQFRK